MAIMVDIYRSGKKAGAYLYVPKGNDLAELPAALLNQFGRGQLAMTLQLSAEKQLAHADVHAVMAQLHEQGFYLQMPPRADSYMQKIPNDKLAVNKF